MTWYKIKDWKFKNLNDNKLDISVIENKKIFENIIFDLVYNTIPNIVVDNIIDDFYGDVEICGNKFSSSIALKSTNWVAYDEMKKGICRMKADEIIDKKPSKPTTYHAMIDHCKIYWE